MCGIIFLAEEHTPEQELRARADKAVATLKHRGPDGSGVVGEQGWAMGHTRLAIIDPIGNVQPIASSDGRYWITYNGEIYNYQELRNSLQTRWNFRTNGDTEVLLAGLILDGPSFLTQLNGMWAFALWDSVERSLFLSRDRLGKKPLYFRSYEHGIAVASELKPLQQLLPSLHWQEDLDSTADFLRYGFALPGFTAFRGVNEVLPGNYLVWSERNDARQARYWSIPSLSTETAMSSDPADLAELLRDSVRLRLIADVDVGAFLSGGIDSSLVSTLAAREMDRPLRTFSIGFSDPAYDESAAAKFMAEAIHSNHESEIVALDHADLATRLLAENFGQPFADASALPMSLLSKLAATKVKVALSGDGADELFAGYQRYVGRILLRWYTRLPISLRKSGERLLRYFPEPLHHHSRSFLKRAHLFVSAANVGAGSYVAPRLFGDSSIAALLPDVKIGGHAPLGLPEVTRGDDIHQMMASDALNYLPQDILVKADRASMAHSLEVRCPFLDHRIVQYALATRSASHIRKLEGKQLLRRKLNTLLPASVWRRRKQGFAVPTGAWFRGQLGERFESLLRQSSSPLNKDICIDLLNAHRMGKRDLGQQLWALWAYFQWSNR